MKFVVYHASSLRIALTSESKAGATRSANAKNKNRKASNERYGNRQLPNDCYLVITQEDYDANVNVMTTTYSMMDPDRRPIPIRAADKGGCCDPATETYWSM